MQHLGHLRVGLLKMDDIFLFGILFGFLVCSLLGDLHSELYPRYLQILGCEDLILLYSSKEY